jgi:lipopolysaccharide heptosyltransferase II
LAEPAGVSDADDGAVLIVGPSWVGDMVMAQALFRRLREQQPQAPIDVLAPGWSLPLIARMPEVRSGVALPFGHGEFGLGARRALGRSLRGRYARAIVLPNSWKSALVPFFAGIPRRTGYRGEWRYGLLNEARRLDRKRLPTTVARFVALADRGTRAAHRRSRSRACTATGPAACAWPRGWVWIWCARPMR